jgi:predicted small metal-binding protein
VTTFACGDVVPGCESTVSAADEEAILDWCRAHARADHGVAEFGPDLVAAVRAAVVTA